MRRVIPFFVLLLLCSVSLRAQEDTSRVRPARTAPFLSLDDSLGVSTKPGARDPMAPAEDSMRVTLRDGVMTEEPETKSPLGAVLRSAVIPGWGQLYNESYLKVPVVLGLTGFLAWGIVTEHANFREYADLYDASITDELPNGNLLHKRFREFYRDRRDTYGWWLLVAYLLQLADAYVDAALFSFDVGDESTLTLIPQSGAVGMQLRF